MAIDNGMLFRILFFSCILVTVGKSNAQNISTGSSDEDSWERFSVRAGGFLASYNGGLQLASKQVGVGAVIDLEDALGISSSTFAFRGELDYKFGKSRRHLISAGYFGIFRNGSKILEEELEIGDVVYPVGEEIKTKFNFTIIRLKYDYTFFQDNRVSLGASFGLFIVPMNLTITSTNLENHNTKFIAPLPLVGLRSNFKITNKLYLNQSAEFLYLTF